MARLFTDKMWNSNYKTFSDLQNWLVTTYLFCLFLCFFYYSLHLRPHLRAQNQFASTLQHAWVTLAAHSVFGIMTNSVYSTETLSWFFPLIFDEKLTDFIPRNFGFAVELDLKCFLGNQWPFHLVLFFYGELIIYILIEKLFISLGNSFTSARIFLIIFLHHLQIYFYHLKNWNEMLDVSLFYLDLLLILLLLVQWQK